MTVKTAFQDLVADLSPIYGEREAQNVVLIVFEDVFFVKNIDEKILTEENISLITKIKHRLLANEPVQYIIGEADFWGLKFKVDKNVLIPRAETEELVDLIIKTCKSNYNTLINILDIGVGSGCIPITIKKKLPQHHVFGMDLSIGALGIAAENALKNQTNVVFFQGDVLDQAFLSESFNENILPQQLEIIVSNPPYIPHAEAQLMFNNVLNYEPHLALFVEDDDPLIFYRRIADFAQIHLTPYGFLFFECNEYNAIEVLQLLENKQFSNIQLIKDMSGKNRMIKAQLKE